MLLPNFNQSSFSFERFYSDESGPSWPKTFIVPDHRIVLISTISLYVEVDALSPAQTISMFLGGGFTFGWWFTYPLILPIGGPYIVNFHPGQDFMGGLPPYSQIDFGFPDNFYLYPWDGLGFQLNTLNANDMISLMTVYAKTWIM
jgi:hypothetical protein